MTDAAADGAREPTASSGPDRAPAAGSNDDPSPPDAPPSGDASAHPTSSTDVSSPTADTASPTDGETAPDASPTADAATAPAPKPLPAPADPLAGPPELDAEIDEPNTRTMVLQLFIFPFLIVLICVAVFLFFGLAAGSNKTYRQYIAEVRQGGTSQRWQAAFQLAKRLQEADAAGETDFFGSEDVNETILIFQAAKNDDPRVRQYLARVLGRLGDPKVLPVLLEVVRNEEEASETRFAAIFGVGMLGGKATSAVPELAPLLRSEDQYVRTVTVYVLGYIGDRSVVPQVEPLLDDPDQNVRWNAALALARLGSDAGLAAIESLLEWKPSGEPPAGLGWDAMFTDVGAYQQSHRRELVKGALAAVAALRAEELRERVEQLTSDPDPIVADAARKALEAIDAPALVPATADDPAGAGETAPPGQ